MPFGLGLGLGLGWMDGSSKTSPRLQNSGVRLPVAANKHATSTHLGFFDNDVIHLGTMAAAVC